LKRKKGKVIRKKRFVYPSERAWEPAKKRNRPARHHRALERVLFSKTRNYEGEKKGRKKDNVHRGRKVSSFF